VYLVTQLASGTGLAFPSVERDKAMNCKQV